MAARGFHNTFLTAVQCSERPMAMVMVAMMMFVDGSMVFIEFPNPIGAELTWVLVHIQVRFEDMHNVT